MKVIEPCEALLSNHEVLEHIQDVKRKHREEFKNRGPAATMKSGNLETVMKELTDYLNSRSIAAQPFNYTHGLVENLVQFGLEKIEILMVLNHLPKNETELDVLVEELETRLSEEQIQTILTAIQQLDEV